MVIYCRREKFQQVVSVLWYFLENTVVFLIVIVCLSELEVNGICA